ncbi:MAG: ABC transporter substrate-binding protein [Dehalococcoidia bacterium]
MFGTSVREHRVVFAAMSVALVFAVSCSSNNNSSKSNAAVTAAATKVASAAASAPAPAASAAASKAAGTAAVAAGGSPVASGAVAETFKGPGGNAPWVNVADGCHGVKAPAGAEAPKASDTGVTPTEIKLGTTFALSGPTSVYSPIIKTIQDCFNAVNADGGIYGRKLNLDVEDDQYIAANTVPLTKKLVEETKIFADTSPLGTPTNTAIFAYMNEQKVPQLFVVTGASKWADNPKQYPWTFGFQPDYLTEGQNYAKYIQQTPALKGKKIGILYQNDDYGKDYVRGLKIVLGDKGTADNPIVDEETYAATDADVSSQITNLKAKGADIFYLVATPAFAGKALKAAADQTWHPTVVMNSVAIASNLPDLSGGNANIAGVIADNYYHTSNETSDPSVKAVQDFLAKQDPGLQLSNFAVVGYMLGQVYVETFKRAGVNLTRDSMIKAVQSYKGFVIPQLLPGITVNTSESDHRPIKCIKLLKYGTDGVTTYFGDNLCP